MVVLAAAICTKAGKAVISRQYREMPRARIEGLLASFPKLTSAGQQHTTIETEHVRYVYQPLDELYVVLITNRQSNILQDIDTLHLFARVVSDICRSTDEREILRHSFELLSTFDEIVSLGYRENVNLAQVKSIIEMESHEEKLQEIIARNKEQEAKEELKRRAKQLEMQKKEMLKRGGGGISGSPFGSSFGISVSRPMTYAEPHVQTNLDDNIRSSYSNSSTPVSKAKGMQLGRKQKGADLFEAVKNEVGIDELSEKSVGQTAISRVAVEPVHVSILEKISMQAKRDGGIENLDVKGEMKLTISEVSLTRIKLSVRANDDNNLQFKTHPNVDRNLFATDNVITVKNAAKGFPVNQSLGVLRWQYSTKDESAVPLSINCWPSPADDGTMAVNIEYELESADQELKDVVISIPLPPGSSPTVGDIDGHYEFNRQTKTLDWLLPIIDASNKQGSLEFEIAGDDVDVFFPVSVAFVSEKLYCNVEVLDITQLENGAPVSFSKEKILTAEQYSIV